MSRVTVVIPTFNRQRMIIEAIRSVLKQSYTNREILIVDDGSTDNTEKILRPWLSKIHYIKKNNGGAASARNVGIRYSTGEYLAFLDSDDQWDALFLERVMEIASHSPTLGLVTTGRIVLPKGVKRPRFPNASLQGDLFPFLFQRNFVTTSGTLVKKACFDRVGWFNEQLDQAEDYDMWLRISKEFPIAFLNEYLCRWHLHSNNISHAELRHQLCLQEVLKHHYDSSRILPKDWQIRRSRSLLSLGKAYLQERQGYLALACFRQALHLNPWRVRTWRYFLRTMLYPDMKRGREKSYQ